MKTKSILVGVAVLLAFNSFAQAVAIDFVTVGNPGNANNGTGFGGVSDIYQIGKYEVTAGQYTEFLNAVATTDTHGLYSTKMWSSDWSCHIKRSGNSGSYTYSVASDYANRPVDYVNKYDCLRFANWLHNGQPVGGQSASTTEDGAYDMSLGSNGVHKTGAIFWLPSDDEWCKAAYHKNDGVTGNYFIYPTSNDAMPGRDMTEATNTGNNANYCDNGLLLGSPYYLTEVGEFELSDSPYGAFDMGGNVWEWSETGFLWGGSYANDGLLMASFRSDTPILLEDDHMGFRIVAIPEPATMVLFGFGGVMLRKRRAW